MAKPSLGIHIFSEFVVYAKANPGKTNLASSRNGMNFHLASELPTRETWIKIVHVPYRGAPLAVTDLLGGHADIMFSDAPFFLVHIKSGKLIPLAVGTPQRASSLPDVPSKASFTWPSLAGRIH